MSTTVDGRPAPAPFKPTDDQVIQHLQRTAVFHETERFKALDRKHAFLTCREYDHQETDWFDMPARAKETISAEAVYPSGTVPTGGGPELDVRDKRPTAPTRRAKVTTERFTNLLFNERSKPQIVVDGDEDTTSFLEAVRKKAKFWSKMRAARNLGGGIGSVAMTVHLREGRWSFEVHNSKFCTPVWKDPRDRSLAGLLIMYRTVRERNKVNDKGEIIGTEMVDYLCRRIITEKSDIIYKEVAFDDAIANPAASWVPEEGLAVQHNLGRFPGVWILNTAVEEEGTEDGQSDCDGAYQSIDTDDRILSQAAYSTLGNMDPTVVTSTDPHAVNQVAQQQGLQKGSRYGIETGLQGSAKYMEMSGAGVTTGLELSTKLQANTDTITGVVIPNDETMAAAQSAEALELRFAPMLAKAGDLREQYGEAIEALMEIVVFMAQKFLSQPPRQLPPDEDGNPRIGVVQFDLPLRRKKDPDTGDESLEPYTLGEGGYVSILWGPWFPPTEADKGQVIQNAAKAQAALFITRATAARRVAPFYGVQDVEGEVAKAEAEAKQAAADQLGTYESELERAAAVGGRP